MTDSGGIQEETSVLGIPCLTLRSTTERPITCEMGTNRVVGIEPASIVSAADESMNLPRKTTSIPLWDGKAAERIADVMLRDLVVS
jgi:UDP-N-acetylglucosamine 2-epimerase (non-hydrolysing)